MEIATPKITKLTYVVKWNPEPTDNQPEPTDTFFLINIISKKSKILNIFLIFYFYYDIFFIFYYTKKLILYKFWNFVQNKKNINVKNERMIF